MTKSRSARLLGASMIALVAACSRGTPDASLASDLEAATSGSALELAPSGAGTKVVSAIERSGSASPRPIEKKPVTVARPKAQKQKTAVASSAGEIAVVPTSEPDAAPTPAPAQSAPAVITQDEDVGQPSARPRAPTPTNAPRSGRRGGVWSTGDVIRNAPFPINP